MNRMLTVTILLLALSQNAYAITENDPILVGWIGGITGPTAKYAAQSGAILAEEEINAFGGIDGRAFKLIYEDGQGNSLKAVNSANKLITQDKVKYIVGGHCSPESVPITSIAEKYKVIMLAAITSTPKLTNAGDFVFRITALSTTGVELLFPFAQKESKEKKYAVLFEETDYAVPLAERFRDLAAESGNPPVFYESYLPNEVDFRSLLLKLKSSQADSLYLSIQSPDAAVVILQQLNDLNIDLKIYGNELAGHAVKFIKGSKKSAEGLVFAEPLFDLQSPATSDFIKHYNKRFNTKELPYGIWTAEAYDAVKVMAAAIQKCGSETEQVKKCLYQTENFSGASGLITINSYGDGVRQYALKKVINSEIVKITD